MIFEGQEVPFPDLLAAAERGQKFVTLPDGSQGLLPKDWVTRWKLLEVGDVDEDGKIRFNKDQGWVLSALIEKQPATDAVAVDEPFANLRAMLSEASTPEPISEPDGFEGELRPYQRDGLGWLDQLSTLRLGGCLADDMGLGKTVQILAYLLVRRLKQNKENRLPSLVVAPRSLVFNWRAEAERFSPELGIVDYTGSERAEALATAESPDLVLTTYGTLRRDAKDLAAIDFDLIVLDEAQAIKNAASQTAAAARGLRARQRLALSGTPVENHLGELGSLLEFLNPGDPRGDAPGSAPALEGVARPSSTTSRAASSCARCGRSSCGGPRTRSWTVCPRRPSRSSSASSTGSSAPTTTGCARTSARASARPAPAAAWRCSRLSCACGRRRAIRLIDEARAKETSASWRSSCPHRGAHRGRSQGADLLAVHRTARDRAEEPRPARHPLRLPRRLDAQARERGQRLPERPGGPPLPGQPEGGHHRSD